MKPSDWKHSFASGGIDPEKQRRPTALVGRHLSKSDLAALAGLRRPGGRLVLGLVALLARPLLARLGAALLARPRLGLRLPALFAVFLLALAHQFLLTDKVRLGSRSPPGASTIWPPPTHR